MTEPVKSPLETFYRRERKTPDKVYLRQPNNLGRREYTWRDVADAMSSIASFLKSNQIEQTYRQQIEQNLSGDKVTIL